MNAQLQQKAQTLGTLLAQAKMPAGLKKAVLTNARYLTEEQVDALIASLREQEVGADKLMEAVQILEKFYDDSLNDLKEKQEAVAEDFVEAELKELDKQDQIDQVKSDINNI